MLERRASQVFGLGSGCDNELRDDRPPELRSSSNRRLVAAFCGTEMVGRRWLVLGRAEVWTLLSTAALRGILEMLCAVGLTLVRCVAKSRVRLVGSDGLGEYVSSSVFLDVVGRLCGGGEEHE